MTGHYCYLVSLTDFLLFLHALVSLIKLAPDSSFLQSQSDFGKGGKDHRVVVFWGKGDAQGFIVY